MCNSNYRPAAAIRALQSQKSLRKFEFLGRLDLGGPIVSLLLVVIYRWTIHNLAAAAILSTSGFNSRPKDDHIPWLMFETRSIQIQRLRFSICAQQPQPQLLTKKKSKRWLETYKKVLACEVSHICISRSHSTKSHYSKSQSFVQKYNFDKTPTISRVFHPNFWPWERISHGPKSLSGELAFFS